jgi:hypothetical protein
VLLFNEPDLVDASPAARRLLDGEHGPGSLPALLNLLSRRFGSDLGERIADLPGEVERWQASCTSPLSLARVSEAVRRTPWNETLRKLDGRDLRLQLTPLPRGAVLVAFYPVPIEREAPSVGLALAGASQLIGPSPAHKDAKLADLLALEDL